MSKTLLFTIEPATFYASAVWSWAGFHTLRCVFLLLFFPHTHSSCLLQLETRLTRAVQTRNRKRLSQEMTRLHLTVKMMSYICTESAVCFYVLNVCKALVCPCGSLDHHHHHGSQFSWMNIYNPETTNIESVFDPD